MNFRNLAGIALVALASPAWAQVAVDLGPAPMSGSGGTAGRISALITSPTDPDKYFAAGADGGVWRTVDGGATWVALTDHMPTTSMGALAMDPTNENTIYAGTGEANFANHSRYGLGLYKTTDGGDTWAHMAQAAFAGRCFSKIVIHPLNSQVLYAAIARAGGFPTLAAAKGHPGAAGPCGVFRSSDGGQTWAPLAGGLPAVDATDLVIDPAVPATLYAATGHIFGDAANGIYKSTDGGDTWVRLTAGLPTDTVGRISLAIARSQPSRLYCLIANPCDSGGGNGGTRGGYRSDDSGATWVAASPGSGLQSTYGWYLSTVAVHPTTPGTVIMGGLTLRRSTNSGSNWSTITPPHVDMHALAFDASGRLVVGDDGGVHRSANLGTSWTSLNTNIATVQFYAGVSTSPADPLVVFGGMQDNGTNRRSVAGTAWTSIAGGDGGWTQVDQTDPQRVFAESQGTGNLYRSTNGGDNFNTVNSGLSGRNCFLPPYLIDPANPMRMLYATERLFESTDGGSNWAALSPDLTGGSPAAIRALAIAPSDSNYVYAATNDGRVQASADGGASFDLRLTDVPGWPRVTRELTVDPTDPRTVYLATAAFGQPQVRRSRDAGATWETLDGNLPDTPVNVVAVDARTIVHTLFAGADDGLYRSINGGLTWRRYGQGLPNAPVIDLRLEPQRDRLIVGTQGRGAWLVPIVYCYADFDDSGAVNINDYIAFLNGFAAGDPRANCDGSSVPPVLNINDFICFSIAAANGCP